MATGDMHKKFGKDWSSIPRDMLMDKRTHIHTDRLTDHNTLHPYRGGAFIKHKLSNVFVTSACAADKSKLT